MIKDVMVRLDGTIADDARLDAAATIARQFEGNLIGLFLNILPSPSPPDPETITATQRSLFAKEARETGDTVMEQIGARLDQLGIPTEIRQSRGGSRARGGTSVPEAGREYGRLRDR